MPWYSFPVPEDQRGFSPTPSLSESLVSISLPSHMDKVLSFSVCVHGSTEVREILEEDHERISSHTTSPRRYLLCQSPNLRLPQMDVKIRSVFGSVVQILDSQLSTVRPFYLLVPRGRQGLWVPSLSSQDHRHCQDQSAVPYLNSQSR